MEARALRALIRDLKAETGDTSEAIAERLDWSTRTVTHALSESETLLAKNAFALLDAVTPGRSRPAAHQLWARYMSGATQGAGWLARYQHSEFVPSVFIPRHEISHLAKMLASRIATAPKARARLEEAIKTQLIATAPRMAWNWRASLLGWALALVVGGLAKISLKGSRDQVMDEVVTLLVEIAYPYDKAFRKSRARS